MNLFFLLAMGGTVISAALRPPGGLAWVAVTHAALFVLLPLAMSPAGARRSVFRLRPVAAVTVAKSILAGALGALVAEALAVVSYFVVTRLGGRPPVPYRALLESGAPPWLLLLLLAVMPALTEEFAFRGFVLSGYARLGGRAAWAGAGLLFALLHLSLFRLPALAALGMAYAYAALRTGSLVPGAVMHLVNNAASLLLYQVAGDDRAPALEGPAAPVPAGALLFWLPVGLGALAPLVAILRSLEPGPAPAAPPDPEPAFSRWWPLLPAGLLAAGLMLDEVARTFR